MARLWYFSTLLCIAVMMTGVSGDSPLELPRLPSDPLQINIEATIYRKNITSGEAREYTVYYEEYRDVGNNRGLSVQIFDSSETRYYYDLVEKQGYSVTRNITTTPLYQAECTTTNFTDDNTGTNYFGGFKISKVNGRFVFSNISDFFQWSNLRNPQYLNTSTVRGISATKWYIPVSTTQGSDTLSYNLTYYFSNNHVMPYYGRKPVPLRLEMTGTADSPDTGSRSFYHVYDFNLIAPLGYKDGSFFATPKGVFCPNRVVPAKSKRTFADQYSLNEEIVNLREKIAHNTQVFFDYTLNLTRTDYQFERKDNPVYGDMSIKVIHDFTYNYQMVINKNTGFCNVTRIPTTGITSWDVVTDNNGSPVLVHTKDMDFNQRTSYQGVRMEKGVLVDVWSMKDVFPNGTVVVQEIWFTHRDWKVKASQSLETSFSVYAGYYYLQYQKGSSDYIMVLQSNAYNQFYGPLQADGNLTNDAFDASECYSKDAITNEHLVFLLADPARMYGSGKVTVTELTRAIRGHLSSLASVSPSRISNIEVYEASAKSAIALKVYFILRAKLVLSDASLSDRIDDESDNAQALIRLEIKLATPEGLLLPVTGTDGQATTMTFESLLSNDEGDVSVQIADKGSDNGNPPKTYTPAAMAGIGIGMLILGAVLTVLVGGLLWIKRFDINLPYLTQNND